MAEDPKRSIHEPARAQPESLRARSLAASLTVDDLEESVAWYCDVVGFTLGQMHEHEGKAVAASLKAGKVRLVLSQDDGALGWDRRKGEGLSLRITTVQDIDDLARAMAERGGELVKEPTDTPWGTRIFQLRDPNGFTFTISSEPGA